MDNKVKFAENVVLIDVAFLNEIVERLRADLGARRGRTLAPLDLAWWLCCLSLDADMLLGNSEIQVLLVHDESVTRLEGCSPSDLKELNGKACRVPLGELLFSCVTPAGMTSCESLFLDLMQLVIDAEDVKKLALIPHPLSGQQQVEEELRRLAGEKPEGAVKKVRLFGLRPPRTPFPCRYDLVSYSLLHALGVTPDELEAMRHE